MTRVIASITTSIDGYITGPNDGPEHGLGEGGERLDLGPIAVRQSRYATPISYRIPTRS